MLTVTDVTTTRAVVIFRVKVSYITSVDGIIYTELDCRRISVIVHRSARDKLAVVDSSCLFGAESYSSQRERKSAWQGFKSKICELVSGKLSKCLYIHSYTHLITSSALNKYVLVHNFQNNCSTECH